MGEPAKAVDALEAFHRHELKCSQCRFIAVGPESLTNHLNGSHKKELCHFCKECARAFEKIDALVTHMITECSRINIYQFKCGFDECPFTHSEPNEFSTHLKHTHKGRSLMPCHMCQQMFTLTFCLIRHIQEQCSRRPTHWVSYNAHNPSPVNNNRPAILLHRPTTVQNNNNNVVTTTTTTTTSQVVNAGAGTSKASMVVVGNNQIGRASGNSFSQASSSSSSTSGINQGAGSSTSIIPPPPAVKTKKKTMEKDLNDLSIDEIWGGRGGFGSSSESEPDDPSWKPGKSKQRQRNFIGRNNIPNTQIPNTIPKAAVEIIPSTAATAVVPAVVYINGYQPQQPQVNNKVQERDKVIDLESSDGEDDSDMDSSSDEEAGPLEVKHMRAWNNWADGLMSIKEDMKLTWEKFKHFFKCMYKNCNFTSLDEESFSKHLQESHQIQSLACLYCFTVYPIGELVEHMVVRHGHRTYQCSICLYRSLQRLPLLRHIKELHEGYGVPLKCPELVTARTIIREPSFVREQENYDCGVAGCQFSVSFESLYEDHYRQTHPNANLFSCFMCRNVFRSLPDLTEHLRKSHGLNQYECSYCKYGTRKVKNILNHLCINHTDLPIEILSRGQVDCSTEEQRDDNDDDKENVSFKQKEVHLSDSSFNVTLMTSDTTRLNNLPQHYENYNRDFCCGINACQKQIKSVRSYRKHLQSAHSDIHNFPCPHCKEISKTCSLAKHHLKLHGPNLYMCRSTACGFYHWEKKCLFKWCVRL